MNIQFVIKDETVYGIEVNPLPAVPVAKGDWYPNGSKLLQTWFLVNHWLSKVTKMVYTQKATMFMSKLGILIHKIG